MITSDKPPRYRAYLLRCWEERERHPDRPGVWRFSLEDPHTGERRGFGDLERLVAFLVLELEGVGEQGSKGAEERLEIGDLS